MISLAICCLWLKCCFVLSCFPLFLSVNLFAYRYRFVKHVRLDRTTAARLSPSTTVHQPVTPTMWLNYWNKKHIKKEKGNRGNAIWIPTFTEHETFTVWITLRVYLSSMFLQFKKQTKFQILLNSENNKPDS